MQLQKDTAEPVEGRSSNKTYEWAQAMGALTREMLRSVRVQTFESIISML